MRIGPRAAVSATNLKPIETKYNGYRFRSRAEARWAVYFDHVKIKYEYEAEGYDLEGTWYLPDFWLPELNLWLEVKGGNIGDDDLKKVKLLAEHSNCCALIAFGMPQRAEPHLWMIDPEWIKLERQGLIKSSVFSDLFGAHISLHLCIANNRCFVFYQMDDERKTISAREIVNTLSEQSRDCSQAIDAARAARFEHGECG